MTAPHPPASLDLLPITGVLGAEVRDVDLRDPDIDFAAIYAALVEHEVLFFRGAALTEEEHLELGRRFGTPSVFPIARLLGATEPTLTVIEDGPDTPNAADVWHTDVTWTATPPNFALLQMEVAPERGGDTLWASATRAYDALSAPVQEFLAGLSAIHDNEQFIERMGDRAGDDTAELVSMLRRDFPPVEHPLIRTHPETGKRAILYAGFFIRRIVGVSAAESRMVLDFLAAHVQDPAFHCRWHWQPGDLAIWDERSTLHRAAADHFPHRRVIRRLEIDGARPYFEPDAAPRTTGTQ